MPLLDFDWKETHARITIWKITENLESMRQLLQSSGIDSSIPQAGNTLHALQKMAVRYLLFQTLGLQTSVLYDEHGKPYLPEFHEGHISISHSQQMVALMHDKHQKVGIDLEKIHPKIQRIYPRFTKPNELLTKTLSTPHLYVYWCAKEALYKLYGKKGTSLRDDISISPFQFEEQGASLYAEILPANWQKIKVNYQTINDYMLAYTNII